MSQVIGRYDLLKPNHKGSSYNLDYFAQTIKPSGAMVNAIQTEELALMNQTLLKDLKSGKLKNSYDIRSTDRAVGANLAGLLALEVIENRQKNNFKNRDVFPTTKVELSFRGSAGQGFGVFCTHGMNLFLAGEANDSVAKSMSGGKISIVSHPDSKLDMAKNVLVGNACLYGATGGKLFLAGLAGDRFAIRNSGAIAVVHGVGLHACEYMTGGKVIILGRALHNIGAGMTGGELFLLKKHISKINKSSISQSHITPEDELFLKMILEEFVQDTQSPMAKNLLFNFADFIGAMTKYVPC
jgi:glutamate synthase domain-containing protein 3